MSDIRIISRLDVKGTRVVKGIFYEGWRDMGDPLEMVKKYYADGVDEILYLDIFASLTQRGLRLDVIKNLAQNIYVPLTVGGGIRSIDDMNAALRAGADKVAINTYAVFHPSIIRSAAQKFGTQCVVVSIEAKKRCHGYEAYVDHGRNITGVDVISWAKRAEELGAGEIILSSVDRDGAYVGFDCELIKAVSDEVSVPIIAGSGASNMEDIENAIHAGADAVAVASLLHYNKTSVHEIKNYLMDKGFSVRA